MYWPLEIGIYLVFHPRVFYRLLFINAVAVLVCFVLYLWGYTQASYVAGVFLVPAFILGCSIDQVARFLNLYLDVIKWDSPPNQLSDGYAYALGAILMPLIVIPMIIKPTLFPVLLSFLVLAMAGHIFRNVPFYAHTIRGSFFNIIPIKRFNRKHIRYLEQLSGLGFAIKHDDPLFE